MDIEYSVTGLDELRGKMRELSFDVRKKGGRSSLRKAALVLRDKARSNAASWDDNLTPESIEKNIVERWNGRINKRSGGNDLAFRIGVLGGARDYSKFGEITTGKKASANPGGDTFYWRFLEFGTSKMAARPFMRPAMDQSGQEVVDTFIANYSKAMDRALKRAKKKKG